MYREFDYIDLGSTMYTPATNKSIELIANGTKFPFLRSVVFCLEDAIKDEEINSAITNITLFLTKYKRGYKSIYTSKRHPKLTRDITTSKY